MTKRRLQFTLRRAFVVFTLLAALPGIVWLTWRHLYSAEQLVDALNSQDYAAAVTLIGWRADPQCKGMTSDGPVLVYALSVGAHNVARVLIDAGADVRASDPWGYTPLHLAAASHDHEMVATIIKKGADVNAQLHEAREGGRHRTDPRLQNGR